MSFGSNIKELRKERRLSQSELGRALNMSVAAISQYELNLRFPDQMTLVSICRFFNISADYLLELSSMKSSPLDKGRIVIDCEDFSEDQVNTIKLLVRAFKKDNASRGDYGNQ